MEQTPEILENYLNKIEQVFGIGPTLRKEVGRQDIIDYYSQSNSGYQIFHSAEGAVHMALNFDGVFNKDGYYEQVRVVNRGISELGARRVLELGSGKGFNSIYLSRRNPDVEFTGIDLTPTHVSKAKQRSRGISNLNFKIGDFHHLEFDAQTFDLLFEVESICHATDMKLALTEAWRVLKGGGRFILFGGFRKPGFEGLDSDLQTASRLVEASLAVDHLWIIDDWVELARKVGFKIIEVRDISEAIKPNLARLQKLTKAYFASPYLAKLFLRFLPPYLVKNSIAGLLMPFTINGGAGGYFMITLEK